MKVLYICFTDFKNINRGSSVRPYKIYNTFINKGYEVILINGSFLQRRKKFISYKNKKSFNNIDYCYIEPSTYPCHPIDFLMFFFIKMLKIPVGLFYRDMYYKFPELFNKTGLKKIELLIRYKIDWTIYKFISNTIFFPSNSMAKYFKFNNKVALPPGGEKLSEIKNGIKNNVIYVGGISKRYGTDILLEALEIVNKTYRRINLILVCREYNKEFFDKYKNEDWLFIKHASGEDLKDLYANSDMAIIPLKEIEYHSFAVPIKLFEYISYAIPVVATNCFETSQFVNKSNIGIIVNDNPESLANGIIDMYNNPSQIYRFSQNAIRTLEEGNLWEHRIKKIEEYLLN